MTLAKNIRYLRKKRNWSQEDLADRLGKKSYTTIQKWESGVADPTFKTLQQLSYVFGVDIDALANGDIEIDNKCSVLSVAEASLIADYRTFNLEGQQKIQEYVSDLISSGKYKKHNIDEMVEDA